MGWTIEELGFDSWWDKRFLHNVHTGPGFHTASYTMDSGGSFAGDKAAGHEVLGFDKSN
jgi:hypothetical protein